MKQTISTFTAIRPLGPNRLRFPTRHREILFASQVEVRLSYQSRRLTQVDKPDFIGFDNIIGKIKAVSKFTDEHRAQVHNYLRATGLKLGLLVNFGHSPKVEWERIVRERR